MVQPSFKIIVFLESFFLENLASKEQKVQDSDIKEPQPIEYIYSGFLFSNGGGGDDQDVSRQFLIRVL